jgi:uncharacterized protein YceK
MRLSITLAVLFVLGGCATVSTPEPELSGPPEHLISAQSAHYDHIAEADAVSHTSPTRDRSHATHARAAGAIKR